MNGELLVFKIWEICKAQGLTKTEFYQRAGVTPSAMTHYKSSTNKPSLDKLLKFAEILNVDPSYLICEVEDKEKDPAAQDTNQKRKR